MVFHLIIIRLRIFILFLALEVEVIQQDEHHGEEQLGGEWRGVLQRIDIHRSRNQHEDLRDAVDVETALVPFEHLQHSD